MLYRIARPFFFSMDPEVAHDLALPAIRLMQRLGVAPLPGRAIAGPRVTAMGLEFPNPLGLAAGMDKNGECIDAFAAFGFGYIEVGTVTPRPQPGNPKPRMFRLVSAQGVINRLGFNNHGVDKLIENVKRARYDGILGVNIGKNFDTPVERAEDDYEHCLRKVYDVASYVTVNISSPNTKDLRQLQQAGELTRLLTRLARTRDALAKERKRRVPLALKIAPDLEDDAIAEIARLLTEFGIDAVIATNTTISRDKVRGLPHAEEAGGLSGAPLRERSTAVIRKLARHLGGKLPIIGVGGIMSGADAREKLEAGATLLQVYTGLIYHGPDLVADILREVAAPRARAAARVTRPRQITKP